MLIQKLTFSLKILVIVLAMCLLATPSALAEFGVSISLYDATKDISAAGGNQVLMESAVDLRVKFDKIVSIGTGMGFDASDITIIAYTKDNFVVTGPTLGAPSSVTPQDGKNYMMTLGAPAANVARVLLYMPKHGVEVADPRADLDDAGKRKADGKSAAASFEVHYVAADDMAPKVVSIRRANDPLLPLGKDDTSVKVVVTLSEQPKEFKKDHISASNADVDGDPVGLTAIEEEAVAPALTRAQVNQFGNPPRQRGIFDELESTADGFDVALHGGIHRAINTDGSGYSYEMLALPDTRATAPALDTVSRSSMLFSAVADDADLPETPTDTSSGEIPQMPEAVTIEAGDYDLLTTADNGVGPPADAAAPALKFLADYSSDMMPMLPNRLDYAALADYTRGVAGYNHALSLYVTYTNALNKYNAYKAAVSAEMQKDQDALDMYYVDTLGLTVHRATGRNNMLYPYVVTLKPKFANKNAIVVKVKAFQDQNNPPMMYSPPATEAAYTEGTDKLTISVNYEKPKAVIGTGISVYIPKEKRIPNGGYLILATNIAGSAITKPAGSDKDEPKNTERDPDKLLYNVIEVGLPNLQSFLQNGGTIDVMAPEGLVISEIMWGTDASLDPVRNSQWIELRNTSGKSLLTGDKNYGLVFYGAGLTLPAASTVKDRVGTVGAGGYWSILGKGQPGRSGVGETAGEITAIVPTQDLVSMQRAIDATGVAADGTMASSWAASVAPAGRNFDPNAIGTRIGSPGAAPVAYPPTPVVVAPTPPPPSTPAATASDIAITELMVDTGGGRLPQWIELTNTSSAAVSLSGWSVVIDNAPDADVYGEGAPVTVSLGDVELGVGEGIGNGDGNGQSVLLVAWASRNSGNFNAGRVINLATQLGQTGRYQLLSYNGFRITLVPVQTSPVLASGDDVGNLGMGWDISGLMSENGRSSLIRREMDDAGMALMGTSADGWRMASATDLVQGPTSWYGSDEDSGTPGYDSAGPLPVELSMFYPARDRLTGQVVIRWETQSELNNAGFFIKRSQQKKGNFVTINATMIQGAGTTSEKQSYTYTDTTAQPNIVYYYQIEDVSLDGNRQLLTRGIRLRGHIGAAGKATTTWGDLKSPRD